MAIIVYIMAGAEGGVAATGVAICTAVCAV